MASHKSGYLQQNEKIRSRSENDSDIAELIYDVPMYQGTLQKLFYF